MPESAFYQPTSLDEALVLLEKHGQESTVVAGGTDVMPVLREKGLAGHPVIIDITRISGLSQVYCEPSRLHIGPLNTHTQIATHPMILSIAPILSTASASVGSPQIRNRGTIGGNLITLAACADTVSALLILEAQLEFASIQGNRSISITDYLNTAGQRIDPTELLVDIHFPIPSSDDWGYFFHKLARRHAAAKSRMSIARMARLSHGKIVECRLAVGAVTPWPRRFDAVGKFLEGKVPTEQVCQQAAKILTDEVRLITGERRSFLYKLPVLEELIQRSLLDLQKGCTR